MSVLAGILARLGNTALGIWMMAAPAVLAYGSPAATNDRIFGPIAASVAIVALWEATRPLRRVNLVIGAWLLVAPFLLGYAPLPAYNSVAVGVLMMAFAAIHGRGRAEIYGGGWKSLW